MCPYSKPSNLGPKIILGAAPPILCQDTFLQKRHHEYSVCSQLIPACAKVLLGDQKYQVTSTGLDYINGSCSNTIIEIKLPGNN